MARTLRKTDYVQFSKRMALAIMIFWGVYRLTMLLLSWFRPEIAEIWVRMLTGVDDVMMVSIGFYTGNSVVEKGIVGYFSRGQDASDTDKDNG